MIEELRQDKAACVQVPMDKSLYIGTCTWNYDSWVGLLYANASSTAAGYLPEYCRQYNTAEIDSWFYHIPSKAEVLAYKAAVPADFRFTCKVPQEICLTHLRKNKEREPLEPNPKFLSLDHFDKFLDAVAPLVNQISAFIFEFEYLNKQKMESLGVFVDKLDDFLAKAPKEIPYALEPRNSNFLKSEYFEFIREKKQIHVFSEKIYMPHIYEVYDKFQDYLSGTVSVIRLLGGDRKKIEEQAKGKWNAIVDPKEDIARINSMISEMIKSKVVFVNVNNHYEGCAPLTIKTLKRAFPLVS